MLFCLVLRPRCFASVNRFRVTWADSDSSPKSIDCEGPGESRTGTRQQRCSSSRELVILLFVSRFYCFGARGIVSVVRSIVLFKGSKPIMWDLTRSATSPFSKTSPFCMKSGCLILNNSTVVMANSQVSAPLATTFASDFVFLLIDQFTVVCSVTWPLNGSEAGGDLVLIKTSLFFLCKSSCSYAN